MSGLARRALALAAVLAFPVETGAKSYLCFGDSITYGDNGSSSTAYLGYLGAYLTSFEGPAEMINQGLSGERTEEGLPRLSSVLATRRTDYVLIMEGTNDIFRWSTDPGQSPDQTRKNLRSMVRAVRSAGEIPVLATVPPRVGDSADPDNANTRTLNDIVRGVASSEGCLLAEVFNNVLPHADPSIYLDRIHPDRFGHGLVAEAFAAAITGRSVDSIDLTPPVPLTVEPKPGNTKAPLDASIKIVVTEYKSGLDPGFTLTVNGTAVTPLQDPPRSGKTTFRYNFPQPLVFGQTIKVAFHVADTASPANALQLDYQFRTTAGNGVNGDIDRSGRVDGVDLALLAAAFGSGVGNSRYLKDADFDASGFVDGIDLIEISQKFGGPP